MNFLKKSIFFAFLSLCFINFINLKSCCFEQIPKSSINNGLDNPVSIDFSISCFAVANKNAETVSVYGFDQHKCIISDSPITTLTSIASQISIPTNIKFSPNGKCLAVINSGNDTITFYQARANCIFNSLAKSSISISNPISIEFSPDAQCVAIGSSDNIVNIYPFDQVLCLIDQSPTTTLTSNISYPISLGYSTTATCFAVLNQNSNKLNLYKVDENCTLNTDPTEIQITDIAPFSNILKFAPSNNAIAISAGKTTSDSTVSFYSFDGDNCQMGDTPITVLNSSNGINVPVDINFSPNAGCFLVANFNDNNIQVRSFDVNNAMVATDPTVTLPALSPIKALFSPNNRCIGFSSTLNKIDFFTFIVRSKISKAVQQKYCDGC